MIRRWTALGFVTDEAAVELGVCMSTIHCSLRESSSPESKHHREPFAIYSRRTVVCPSTVSCEAALCEQKSLPQ